MTNRSPINPIFFSALASLALHATGLGVLALAMTGEQIRWQWETKENVVRQSLDSAYGAASTDATPADTDIEPVLPRTVQQQSKAMPPVSPNPAAPPTPMAVATRAPTPMPKELVRSSPRSAEMKSSPALPKIHPGDDRAADPLAMSWISYDDFEKLVARKGGVDQAAQQRDAQPVSGAPPIPDPNSGRAPGDGTRIAADSASGHKLDNRFGTDTQQTNGAAGSPGTPGPLGLGEPGVPGTPEGDASVSLQLPPATPHPDILSLAAINAETAVPPTSSALAVAGSEDRAAISTIVPDPARSSPTISDQLPVGDELTILGNITRNLPIDPSQPGVPLRSVSPPPRDEQDTEASKVKASGDALTKTLNQPPPVVTGAATQPAQARSTGDIALASIPIAFSTQTPQAQAPQVVITDANAHGPTTQPAMRISKGVVDAAGSEENGNGGPPTVEGVRRRAGQPNARLSSSPLSDRQAQPVSLTDSPLPVRLGGVVTSEGMRILTAVPDLSVVARFIIPNNPTARLVFDRQGFVTEVSFIKGCGNPTWDSPILACLYKWRATGSKLAQINGPFEMEVHILLVEE